MTAGTPSVRASDADRERVAAIISAAAGKGMLTMVEADERLAQVYAARYLSELEPITADLPDGGASLLPVDPQARAAERAAARSALVRRVGLYVGPYLGLVGLLTVIWVLSGGGYFWPVWPIVFLGIGTFKQSYAPGSWGHGRRGYQHRGYQHRGYRGRRHR